MLSRVKLQHVAGTTVSDDLNSVAGACERRVKRAKKTWVCNEPPTTLSTAEVLNLLNDCDDLIDCCKELSW